MAGASPVAVAASRWRRSTSVIALAAVVTVSAIAACSTDSEDCEMTRRCRPSTDVSGAANGGAIGPSGDAGEPNAGTSGTSGGKGGAGSSGSSSGGKSGMGGSSGMGGVGEGRAGGGSPGCDRAKSPTEESCLVSDDYAVFVAPTGDDGQNDGSQAAPLASVTKAAEVAAGEKLILVCDATYNEHVAITSGAHVYGGFKCSDWTVEDAKPLFKPTTAGPALKIDGVDDEVVIQGLSFEVGDATMPGETALTAIVNQSPKVTLRSVSLKAGKGKAGANGNLATFTPPGPDTLNGNAENPAMVGGSEKICVCQAGLMSVGGGGGTPNSSGQNGSKGLPDHGAGQGGDPSAGDCGAGGTGRKGANATAPGPAGGAATLGAATVSGWQPMSGADGETGSPGQGGGGGASLNSLGHGGGGGCGGCGGSGGTGGKGGGASIALLALNSPLDLEACTVGTADAGNGGSGAAGQAAKPDIGAGGSVISSINSCPGGVGGKGADGGAGGGGAGGISVGIVWKGAKAPTLSADTTVTNGKAGMKGIGGEPGTNDGIAGVAQKLLALN